MATPLPLRPDPPRILLIAAGQQDPGDGARRHEQLEGLLSSDGVEVRTRLVLSDQDELPDPRAFGAVVVDGEPGSSATPEWLADLHAAVESGTSVLAIARPVTHTASGPSRSPLFDWLGVRVIDEQPAGEWFAKVAFGKSGGLTERVAGEFAIVDRLACLEPTRGDTVPVLEVSIGFRDRTVMLERRLGHGRIIVSGLGNDRSALSHHELATLLRRALVPALELTHRDRSIGFAVLGYGPYGGMGLYHGLAANATPGLEMIAACDSDPARRKAAEEEFPGLRPYAGVAELSADEDVEVVVVATPPSTHFELARSLLGAGKHVALEKPMCLALAEADELLALARASNLVLTVHQSRRWDPDFLAVRRAVDQGLVGEIFNVETFVGGFEHPCRAWHSEVTISGGAVYDWGSHHLDWILQLMGGFPRSLAAHGHKRVWRDVTNLDQVRVRLTWPDGREAEFMQSDIAAVRRPKFYVQGTEGTIAGHYRPLLFERLEPGVGYIGEQSHHAEAPVQLTLARYEPGYGVTEMILPPASADRYGFHRNLADHLTLGEPLAVTPESSRDVVALLEAAQRSTDQGNVPVTLGPPAS
ncbi:MAG: Gfo/Idh/MocA family protein [Acidimicrobiales bacterium]